ncbi:glycosyltransferase family 4 protein [Saccharothrix variisporea]|uniref:Glycosyltransferase involved in cell wall biosynthesis n=1 Tax=Saccharothrix variisporea TaxID=543527 RepID=A0A495XPV8_9PSEU|nr:glycosyltransferase family 4 protein [Saccharothrix variisporea]RKT74944.1 glycosyltransferase involved in cell wall biosynthesis [Saccharothrix variisporea]
MSGSHAFTAGQRARRALRVALVVPPYFDVPPKAYGGVEAVVADLADALVARGHAVTLVGAGEPGTKARFVPVWDRTVPERLGEPYPEVMHALAARRAVERLIAEDGVDVVHDHTFGGPLNAPRFAELGVPTVATVHGPVDADLRRYYRALGRDVHLVAISDRQRELAPELNWVGTVHNALRVADWPFQESKEDYALFLGRFHPDKAPHLALDAAHAAGLPVVLAGKCAEPVEKAYFEAEVKPRLTERDHVFGVADATEKRKLLAAARCLLFPIRWEEPFGMVMIEAMACGTPVVALRAGAVPEVVVDGVTGLVRDHPDELVQALHDVRDLDPAACREHVAEHFGAEALGAGYEAAYLRALEPSSSVASLRRDFAALDDALDQAMGQDALDQAMGHNVGDAGPAAVSAAGDAA